MSKQSLFFWLPLTFCLYSAVFFVDASNRKRLLLRVYGIGVDQIIDRDNELAWIARLSHLNIGPSLLGVFGNGRFEQYLPSKTLTSAEIRIPDISKQIAACTRELHDIVTVYPPDRFSVMEVWNNVDKWYKLAVNVLPDLIKKSNTWAKALNDYDLKRLAHEIQECKQILASVNSPIVFAQNDVCFIYINGALIRGEGSMMIYLHYLNSLNMEMCFNSRNHMN